ncbi:MAG: hypothetical protein WD077_15450 [Bacteroidia bacterium]
MLKNANCRYAIVVVILLFILPGCKDEADYRVILHPEGEFLDLPAKPQQELLDYAKDVLRKRLITAGFAAEDFIIAEKDGAIEIQIDKLEEDTATGWLEPLLTIPGNFRIVETYHHADVIGSILTADAYLAHLQGDTAGQGPLLSRIKMASYQLAEGEEISPTPVIGFAFPSDTASIFRSLKIDSVKAILPAALEIIPGVTISDSLIPLIAVRSHYRNEGLPALTKNFVQDLSIGTTEGGVVVINLQFNENGGEYFYELTMNNFRSFIGIVLDETVIHYAMIQGGIPEGKISIISPYGFNQTRAIAAAMRISSLPFPMAFERNMRE